jgi:hypothetical protein
MRPWQFKDARAATDVRRVALVMAFGAASCTSRGDRVPEVASNGATASEWTGDRADGSPASVPASGSPGLAARPPSGPGGAPWVLHVGDSFVDAYFKQNLAPRFRAAGAKYVVRATTATYTTTWATDPAFADLLTRRPSLVILTLGANEFDIASPERHSWAVEAIARKVARSGAACVWTSPPMWTRDTGIVAVIHDHCAPCLFFDSDAVLGGLSPDERRGDHIHPNHRGGARWAEAFWDWLGRHREHGDLDWDLVPFERR